MSTCLGALLAGLLVGGIVGVWLGAAGRVWTLVFRKWTRGGGP